MRGAFLERHFVTPVTSGSLRLQRWRRQQDKRFLLSVGRPEPGPLRQLRAVLPDA
jgi:hypothetical protein